MTKKSDKVNNSYIFKAKIFDENDVLKMTKKYNKMCTYSYQETLHSYLLLPVYPTSVCQNQKIFFL